MLGSSGGTVPLLDVLKLWSSQRDAQALIIESSYLKMKPKNPGDLGASTAACKAYLALLYPQALLPIFSTLERATALKWKISAAVLPTLLNSLHHPNSSEREREGGVN